MTKEIIEPTTTKTDRGRTLITHPAFAQIGASRTNGHATLYASDFIHHATIRIRICKSQLVRDLSHDWHHGDKEYIEVEMSEAQWATFISAMNIGDGVPCTLRHLNYEETPRLPPPKDRSKQFAGELDNHCKKCIDDLTDLLEKVNELKLPKGKTAELQRIINHAIMTLQCNLPFVAKSFGEHTENTVESAKQEIHGYMMGVINRAGLTALNQEPLQPPLLLEDTQNHENQ